MINDVMADPTGNNIPLTAEKLKEDMRAHNKRLFEKIHQNTSFGSHLSLGVTRFFQFLSSILASNTNIPLVGAIFQFLTIILQSVAIVTNPKKPLAAKIGSLTFLSALAAVSLAALFLGTSFAAIVGVSIAAVFVLTQSLKFVKNIIRLYNTSQEYHKRAALDVYLKSTDITDELDELLTLRHIQLIYEVKKRSLKKEKNETSIKEIDALLQEIKLIQGKLENKPPINSSKVIKLKSLYAQRDQILELMVGTIAFYSSNPDEKEKALTETHSLQAAVLAIDKKIEKITLSKEQLAINQSTNTRKFLLAGINLAITAGGSLTAIIGVILITGSVALPPFVLPLLVGYTIAVTALGLIAWGINTYAKYQSTASKMQADTQLKEDILEEAFTLSTQKRQLDSSDKKLLRFLEAKPVAESESIDKDVPVRPPLFPEVDEQHKTDDLAVNSQLST